MMDLSPLTWMWILSIAGALAFTGLGALGASAARRAAAAQPLARALAEVAALDDDRRKLADEVMRLSEELAEQLRAHPPADEGAARNVELELLRRRAAEAEELRLENERLRTQLAQARTAIHAAPPARHRVPRATGRLATQPAIETLDGILAQLRADPNVASAVISDELGLLVAGGGAGAETMAALGGYLAGVGARAQGLLHLDAAARVIVEDDHGKVLTATRLPGAPLVAVTLARA
jgi:predicted regulator of Ras-like GTPase activity (Roadblock/LC7/MglB family)